MIGIDTNILIRFFAEDDPAQFQLARALMEKRLTVKEPGYVTVVTMAELVWVLRRSYGLSEEEVFRIVELMLRIDVLIIQNGGEVGTAAAEMRAGRGTFADLLIRELSGTAGCKTTMTFDRKASRLDGFTLLES